VLSRDIKVCHISFVSFIFPSYSSNKLLRSYHLKKSSKNKRKLSLRSKNNSSNYIMESEEVITGAV
jgi:hypothetical protein